MACPRAGLRPDPWEDRARRIAEISRSAYIPGMNKAIRTSRFPAKGGRVIVEKRPSGREIWRLDGEIHVPSPSTAAAMDRSVKKYRKTLERLAKR